MIQTTFVPFHCDPDLDIQLASAFEKLTAIQREAMRAAGTRVMQKIEDRVILFLARQVTREKAKA